MPPVTIIVPVFNKSFLTKRFLESTEKLQVSSGFSIDVIVVDNGSTDDTPSLSVAFPHVTWMRNDTNLGFAKACNIGIRTALKQHPSTDILICNNDVEFNDNCIRNLVEFAYSNEAYGVVGGKLFLPDGRLQHAGAFLNVMGWGQHLGGGSVDGLEFSEPREVEYVAGALFFIKNIVTVMVGLFDEQYFLFFEDVDYCYRVRKSGWKVMYCPTATATHYENSTGKDVFGDRLSQLSHESQVKFWKKFPTFYENNSTSARIISNAPRVLVNCKIYGEWSFSIVMRNLCKGLARNGVDVSIAPQEYHDVDSMTDWEIKDMINKPNDWWDRVCIRSCEGDNMYMLPPGKVRIAHTTNETTYLHPGWVEQLNHVDVVWTTSTFFKRTLQKNGVTTPIEVIPNSVDFGVFKPLGPRVGGLPPSSFYFLSVFSFCDRKAPDSLVRAYTEEFRSGENVCLILHSPYMGNILRGVGLSPEEWVKQVAPSSYAPIVLSTFGRTPEYMASLYRTANCFVLPSRAEGFGLPYLEAAACGVPSIATAYGGQLDFLSPDIAYLVDYEMIDIPLQLLPYFRNYTGGQWADPNVPSLRKAMRRAFENRNEVVEMGQRSLEVAQGYSIENVGKIAREKLVALTKEVV